MGRTPLDRDALSRGLPAPWTRIEVVERLESTNRVLLEQPAAHPPGTVLVAEHQVEGRGRLGRTWVTPARSALTFSVSVRPSPPPSTWGWLPLLAGVAVRDAVVSATGLRAGLKWPNDLLVGAELGKAAGILVQAAADVLVLGIGLNVSTTTDELPVPTATSLELAGAAPVERSELLLRVLTELGARYLGWQSAGGNADACGLAAAYRDRCLTIGQQVIVTGIGRPPRAGVAAGIDDDGRLVLDVDDGHREVVAAGDVEHLRSAADPGPKSAKTR
jgi:BirA family transcriptional regulator, biotin operon repressor / biotin---[acetyl-CoA-carboxylase] ligase